MFCVGDKIMYGSMGVCTVTDICVPDLPGAARQCYILKPHFVANSKVYAPVENNSVSMRLLMSCDEARSLIQSMPEIAVFTCGDKQEQYSTYKGVIKSADSFLLAKLMKSLYERKAKLLEQKKGVPSAEKDFFDTARQMLFGEFAEVFEIPLNNVESYISQNISGGDRAMETLAS